MRSSSRRSWGFTERLSQAATHYVRPESSRPRAPARWWAPSGLNGGNLYAGDFWGYLKTTGTPAEFPTLTQWLANSALGYAFPSNGGTVSTGVSALQYLGFGYGPSCT
jgi:hypothetical protein